MERGGEGADEKEGERGERLGFLTSLPLRRITITIKIKIKIKQNKNICICINKACSHDLEGPKEKKHKAKYNK
jgi:hypothetical protein